MNFMLSFKTASNVRFDAEKSCLLIETLFADYKGAINYFCLQSQYWTTSVFEAINTISFNVAVSATERVSVTNFGVQVCEYANKKINILYEDGGCTFTFCEADQINITTIN